MITTQVGSILSGGKCIMQNKNAPANRDFILQLPNAKRILPFFSPYRFRIYTLNGLPLGCPRGPCQHLELQIPPSRLTT